VDCLQPTGKNLSIPANRFTPGTQIWRLADVVEVVGEG